MTDSDFYDVLTRLTALERDNAKLRSAMALTAATAVQAVVAVLVERGVLKPGDMARALDATLAQIDDAEPHLAQHPVTDTLLRLAEMQAVADGVGHG